MWQLSKPLGYSSAVQRKAIHSCLSQVTLLYLIQLKNVVALSILRPSYNSCIKRISQLWLLHRFWHSQSCPSEYFFFSRNIQKLINITTVFKAKAGSCVSGIDPKDVGSLWGGLHLCNTNHRFVLREARRHEQRRETASLPLLLLSVTPASALGLDGSATTPE